MTGSRRRSFLRSTATAVHPASGHDRRLPLAPAGSHDVAPGVASRRSARVARRRATRGPGDMTEAAPAGSRAERRLARDPRPRRGRLLAPDGARRGGTLERLKPTARSSSSRWSPSTAAGSSSSRATARCASSRASSTRWPARSRSSGHGGAETPASPRRSGSCFRIGVNLGDVVLEAAATSTATGSTSRPAWRARASPAALWSPAPPTTTFRASSTCGFEPARRAARQEHRAAGARLPRRAGTGSARSRRRRPPLPEQALDRRAAVRQHERRSRAGLLQRRHHRGHHHRPVEVSGLVRDRPQLVLRLQGQGGGRAARSARELGVRYVLEGSVRKAGGRVRITAQLVDAATGGHLWAERYDGDLDDIFALQDEITREDRRGAQGDPAAGGPAGPRGGVHPQRRGPRAVPARPAPAPDGPDPAVAGEGARPLRRRRRGRRPVRAGVCRIAECDCFLHAYHGREVSPEEMLATSERALAFDPNLADAYAARGQALAMAGRFMEAEQDFTTAIGLDPNLSQSYLFYARLCYLGRRLEEAARLFLKAADVRPDDFHTLGMAAMCDRDLGDIDAMRADARLCLGRARAEIERHPDNPTAAFYAAVALALLGERADALAFASRALALDPDDLIVQYNVACAMSLLGEPSAPSTSSSACCPGRRRTGGRGCGATTTWRPCGSSRATESCWRATGSTRRGSAASPGREGMPVEPELVFILGPHRSGTSTLYHVPAASGAFSVTDVEPPVSRTRLPQRPAAALRAENKVLKDPPRRGLRAATGASALAQDRPARARARARARPAGPALAAGRHPGRGGGQLRRVLGPRRAGRAVPVRSGGRGRDCAGSSCPSAPTRSSTGTCRA